MTRRPEQLQQAAAPRLVAPVAQRAVVDGSVPRGVAVWSARSAPRAARRAALASLAAAPELPAAERVREVVQRRVAERVREVVRRRVAERVPEVLLPPVAKSERRLALARLVAVRPDERQREAAACVREVVLRRVAERVPEVLPRPAASGQQPEVLPAASWALRLASRARQPGPVRGALA